jgi:DNA-binding MarR family transcriptional regulator
MTSAFEDLANLDRMVHEPARLSILTALSTCQSADFLFLQRLTGLTGGNLGAHLNKLEETGLVATQKQFVDRRPNTLVSITPQGREAIERHWQQLEDLRKSAKAWKPDE